MATLSQASAARRRANPIRRGMAMLEREAPLGSRVH